MMFTIYAEVKCVTTIAQRAGVKKMKLHCCKIFILYSYTICEGM